MYEREAEMSKFDYQTEIHIDPTKLDLEWIDQPNKRMQFSQLCADAQQLVRELKNDMDVLEAQIMLEVYQNPDKFNLPKLTVDTAKAAVELDPRVRKIKQEYLEAQNDHELLKGALDAIDDRKKALENLVSLLIADYFSGPKTPRDIGSEYGRYKAEREKTQSDIAYRLSKRKERDESKPKRRRG